MTDEAFDLRGELADKGIYPKAFTDGDHRCECPECHGGKGKRDGKTLQLTIKENGSEAVWMCYRGTCGETGGVRQQSRNPHRQEYQSKPKTEPRQPANTPLPQGNVPDIQPLTVGMKALLDKRGIDESVAVYCRVGAATRYVPGEEKECPTLAFPYYRPSGEIVNAKFRSQNGHWTQVKDGGKQFWLLDKLIESVPYIVIAEGEFDAMALLHSGLENVLSVPDGAPATLKDEAPDPAQDRKFSYVHDDIDVLDNFDKIIFAGDNDQPGKVLTEEIARRFGKVKCWIVQWPDDCKDANDVLLKHGPEKVLQCVEAADPYPIQGVYRPVQYRDQLFLLYADGRDRGISTGWQSIDELYRVRPGELTIVTGTPGQGKSEFVDALMVNLSANEGWRHAICSFENPPDEHISKLAEKHCGFPFWEGPTKRMTEAELQTSLEWIDGYFTFIRAEEESPTIDWLIEKIETSVLRYGIRGCVIDPYNEMEHKRPASMTETEYIGMFLARLKRLAQNRGIHIWLVAHPTKIRRNQDGTVPGVTLYDISGSANWYNKADVGVVIARGDDIEDSPGFSEVDVSIKKVRFKSVGKPGDATLQYEKRNGRYSDGPDDPVEPPPSNLPYADDTIEEIA